MEHCARCRADACGLIGEEAIDVPNPKDFSNLPSQPTKHRPYVAVATREGVLVNLHVGETEQFHIFKEVLGSYEFLETRKSPEAGSGIKRWLDMAEILHDCRAILTTGVGAAPRRVLTDKGLEMIEMEGLIEEGLTAVFGGTAIAASLRRTFRGCSTECQGGGGGCG